jgi:hypothetical protein
MLFGREIANTDHVGPWLIWLLNQYFLDDPTVNPWGYTLDDMMIHYAYDTVTCYGSTLGWNPADDTDGDGIRDIEPPSDSLRTASTLEEARTWRLSDSGATLYLGTLSEHARHKVLRV